MWLSYWVPVIPAADHRANKSLILITGRDISLLGYTGTAVINGLPTDDWLAGAICSTDRGPWSVPDHDNSLQASSVGQVLRSMDACVDEARRAMGPKACKQFHLEVQIVGYRLKKRRLLPFAFVLAWIALERMVRAHARPLEDSSRHGVVYFTPSLSPEVHERAMREMSRPAQRPLDFHNNMASAMTEVSLARSGVGTDLLGIAIHAASKRGHLVFRQPTPDTIAIEDFGVPIFRTPWVLGPGHAHQPADHSGNGTLEYPGTGLTLTLPLVELPPGTMVSSKWTADRRLNGSRSAISHDRPIQNAEIDLEAGRHEMLTALEGSPYRPPPGWRRPERR